MSAFNKVLELMQSSPLNGHSIKNIQNIKSLAKANKEIEKLMISHKVSKK